MRRFTMSFEDNEQQPLSPFEVPESLPCADAPVISDVPVETDLAPSKTVEELLSRVTSISDADACTSQLMPVENVVAAGCEVGPLELAAESFKSCMTGQGTESEFRLASAVYARSRVALGMEETCTAVSLENFSTGKHSIAFESVIETIRAVGAAILKAIIAAIDWFKKVIRQYTKDSEALIKAVVTMTTGFLAHRQKNKDKLAKLEDSTAIDFVRYVDLVLYKKALTMLGAQPTGVDGYAKEVAKITELARTHELIKTNITPAVIVDFNKVIEAKGSFIEISVPDTRLMLFNLGEPVFHACGITAQDDQDMFALSELLGDHVVVSQFTKRFIGPANTDTSFKNLAGSKLTLTKEKSEMMDGWLRKLTDDEVKKMFVAMTNLSHVVKDHGKTEDLLVHHLDSLKVIAIKATEAAKSINQQFATTAQLNSPPTLSRMTVGISSLVSFINEAMLVSVKPARELQIAWLHYLQATIRREQAAL